MLRKKFYLLVCAIMISMIETISCLANVEISSEPIELIIGNVDRLGLPVEVNNTLGWFLLDTGADISSVTSNFGKKARLKNPHSATLIFNGRPFETVKGSADIRVGKSWFKNNVIMTIEPYGPDFDYDGILGYDILSKAKFVLDYSDKKLIFYEKIDEVEHSETMEKSHSAFIKVNIGDCSFTALLDTGINKTIVARDEWNDVVKCGNASKFEEHGEIVQFGVITSASHTSGRVPVRIVVAGAKSHEMYVYKGNEINLLGLDFIKQFRINHIGGHNFIFE